MIVKGFIKDSGYIIECRDVYIINKINVLEVNLYGSKSHNLIYVKSVEVWNDGKLIYKEEINI